MIQPNPTGRRPETEAPFRTHGTSGSAGAESIPDGTTTGKSARGATSRAKEQVSHYVEQARERIDEMAAAQKVRAAERIEHVAHALREAGRDLHDQQDDHAAHYAELLGDQLERASRSLREQDLRRMIRGAEDFARRHPAIFLGGMAMIGMAAARFLRSSSEHQLESHAGEADDLDLPRERKRSRGPDIAPHAAGTSPVAPGERVMPAGGE